MDLFTRLATQQLAQQSGHGHALRPVLPATYASRLGPNAPDAGLEVEAFQIKPPASPPAGPRPAGGAAHAVMSVAASSVAAMQPQARPTQAPQPGRGAAGRREGSAAAPIFSTGAPPAAHERPALQPLPAGRPSEARGASARTAQDARRATAVDTPPVRPRPPASAALPQAIDSLPQSRRAPLAPATSPLSSQRASMLGAFTARAQPAVAPVVHLHIDRIEVRAPVAPPKAAPARPARALPSVSLTDYLRKGGPR